MTETRSKRLQTDAEEAATHHPEQPAGHQAWFRCSAGCSGQIALTEVVYECPRCRALLEVAHDLERLRERSAGAWMKVFDDRYKRTTWPYGSGVWGKKEWVAPHVSDGNVVSLDEGGTSLFWAERYGDELGLSDLWVKMCGNSHTGSFKDLGMTVLVDRKSTRLNSSHANISYAVFCLKKKQQSRQYLV